jgi:hypothetical protein
MSDEDRGGTAFHESSHALVAFVLRQPIRYVSIRKGQTYLGVMARGRSAPLDESAFRHFGRPAIVQPAKLRRHVEAEAVLHLIERIVGPLGLRVDESSPWADARLPEGSRVQTNFLLTPLSQASFVTWTSANAFTTPCSLTGFCGFSFTLNWNTSGRE